MPSIMERYVQGLLLGEKFKDTKRQRKWEDLRQQLLSEQIEDVRQGRKAKQKLFALLKDPQSGMGKLAPFVEAGESLATAADITGYTSPEEQRGIAEEYTSVDPETIQALGLPLSPLMGQATITPMGMTVPIKGEPLDISKELRLRMPKAPTPSKPTETQKTRQRRIKYLMDQGMSRQEAEDYLTQRGIYGKTTEPKRMTSASYRSQASSLEAQAGKSTDEIEQKALFEKADMLRKEADKLFRQEQQRSGMIPDIPSLPARVTPVGLEEEEPPEVEEPPIELPPSLIDELGDFESFDEWYDSLPEDAQAELEAEPETLKAIRDWYAVPQ